MRSQSSRIQIQEQISLENFNEEYEQNIIEETQDNYPDNQLEFILNEELNLDGPYYDLSRAIDCFFAELNLGDTFSYSKYLTPERNYLSYIKKVNDGIWSEQFSNHWEIIEGNRKIITSNVKTLVKFIKGVLSYLKPYRVGQPKTIKIAIAYFLYSSGLILVNLPALFTKHCKKEKIIKVFEPFWEQNPGRKSPPRVYGENFKKFCTDAKFEV